MRMIVGDVECPKCHHIFDYDSGDIPTMPFKTIQDATDWIVYCEQTKKDDVEKEYTIIGNATDGYVIHTNC